MKIVYSNPVMKVIDIKGVAEIVHSKTKAILVVDNTFLSAYFQRPLDLGADVVMYSLTKYMNGHTDVVMGSASTNSDELHEKLRFYQNATGTKKNLFICFESIQLNSIATQALFHRHSTVIW